jgi:phenylacetate-coenzyme A ligase PaaK-like adenylate-forming protein/molybdenum cofactor biosynthesis enzyme MoaA
MYPDGIIQSLHLELTERCNAGCPMCARSGWLGQSQSSLRAELRLADVKALLPQSFLVRLRHILLCGNYGDPAQAGDALAIVEYLRSASPVATIALHTNGSLRTPRWWRELASILGTFGHVRFGIDGLQDTNAIYRRGTNWGKVMDNAQSFIAAGGRAEWDYLVFRHNEHQVEDALALARRMGFVAFFAKRTNRFTDPRTLRPYPYLSVTDRAGREVGRLEPPDGERWRNPGSENPVVLAGQGEVERRLSHTEIRCKAVDRRSFYVSARGYVMPCCWLAVALDRIQVVEGEQVHALLREGGGVNAVNGFAAAISSIVAGELFRVRIPGAWKSGAEGRLRVCARVCGAETGREEPSDNLLSGLEDGGIGGKAPGSSVQGRESLVVTKAFSRNSRGEVVAGVDAFMTKADLRARLPTEDGGRVLCWTSSSGTTGEPVLYPWTEEDEAAALRTLARIHPAAEQRQSGCAFILAPTGLPGMWRHMERQVQHLGLASVLPPLGDPDWLLALGRRLRPVIVISLPLVLSRLGERAAMAGLLPADGIEDVFCGGDVLSEARRVRLEKLWGCRVRNFYGASEAFGPMAATEPGDGVFHWLSSDVSVDVLDPLTKEPVATGQTGVAVLTAHWPRPVPLHRYWTGDVFEVVDRPGPDGLCFRMRGREGDALSILRSGRFCVDVDDVLLADPAVGLEWAMDRIADRVRIRVEAFRGRDAIDPATMRRLQDMFSVEIAFEAVALGCLDRSIPKLGGGALGGKGAS